MSVNNFDDYPLTWKPNRKELKRPMYQSLVEQLQRDIENGTLTGGTKLPPQRELADFLDINFTTITRVYKLAEQKGLTYGIVGNGTFIAASGTQPNTISRNESNNYFAELGFVSSFEECNVMVTGKIKQVMTSSKLTEMLTYDEPAGMWQHRRAGIMYMKRFGYHASINNMVIASGGQNALAVALSALFSPGDQIVVDFYTYANFIELAKMYHIRLIPVNGDNNGMSPNLLEEVCWRQHIKGIYLMPSSNNPTTIFMNEIRRTQIASLIERFHLILIEDDYLGFINMGSTIGEILPIAQLVPDRSIYICSTSKSIASGLRVAYMAYPDRFKQTILNSLFNINVKTSSIDSEIVSRLILSGDAYKIIEKKKKLAYQANQVFNAIFPVSASDDNYLSFFRWLPLTKYVDRKTIEDMLLHHRIRAFHSDRFTLRSLPDTSFLRISLASCSSIEELKRDLLKLRALLIPYL